MNFYHTGGRYANDNKREINQKEANDEFINYVQKFGIGGFLFVSPPNNFYSLLFHVFIALRVASPLNFCQKRTLLIVGSSFFCLLAILIINLQKIMDQKESHEFRRILKVMAQEDLGSKQSTKHILQRTIFCSP